ncbi:MAG TPA: hypothetical protein VFC19_53290 [Candidatus Limnocylindrales bacterium]|nr:hypothetical protein [Candidatus Limnocylindrales bacterium]
MRLTRMASAFITAGLVFFTTATPALAAPPANDTFGNAIAITSLPFSASLDTREATTDAIDEEANTNCGAPATAATVWYTYTAPADDAILLDMSGTNYSGGFLVATGAPGDFTLIGCGPRAVAVPIEAGVTYHIMVLDDDDTANGGDLTFTVRQAPPPPEVTLAVNPTGSHDPATGSATVSGTLACVGEVEFSLIIGELHQRVGRGEVVGANAMEVTCDGVARPWSLTIEPQFGTKFAGGKAASFTFGVACGPVFCHEGFVERTVQLKRNG